MTWVPAARDSDASVRTSRPATSYTLSETGPACGSVKRTCILVREGFGDTDSSSDAISGAGCSTSVVPSPPIATTVLYPPAKPVTLVIPGTALKFGHRDVHDLLVARSPVRIRFLNALLSADAHTANPALAETPSLLTSLTPQDHAQLVLAIFHERFDAADLMLRIGLDPAAPGVDGGTALHAACWVGSVRMVERILARGSVPLDARDPTHRSTPLDWAAFGSVHRRSAGADYAAVADRLVAAGADITALGNGPGRTLLEMTEGNPSMQEALRQLSAG